MFHMTKPANTNIYSYPVEYTFNCSIYVILGILLKVTKK